MADVHALYSNVYDSGLSAISLFQQIISSFCGFTEPINRCCTFSFVFHIYSLQLSPCSTTLFTLFQDFSLITITSRAILIVIPICILSGNTHRVRVQIKLKSLLLCISSWNRCRYMLNKLVLLIHGPFIANFKLITVNPQYRISCNYI